MRERDGLKHPRNSLLGAKLLWSEAKNMPPACFLNAPTPYGWNKIVALEKEGGGSKSPPYGGTVELVRR